MSSPPISNAPSFSDNKISETNVQSTQLVSNDGQAAGTSRSAAVYPKPRPASKFTRGEKCLFTHLVVTFAILLLLFIVFVVHLYVVRHHGNEMFEGILRRRVAEEESDSPPVGVVYVLPDYYMCNSLLLRPRWSLAPAHCVAARSEPNLAYALPSWRITYEPNTESVLDDFSETLITRSVPHPHFNRDDFQNNIGLFQHEDALHHLVSNVYMSDVSYLNDYNLRINANDLKLISWEDSWHLHGHVVQNPVQPLSPEKCKLYVSPVVDIRDYEHCVTMMERRNVSIAPGAVLAMKSEFVGIFTWGDSKGRGLPFVILNLEHYKDWITYIVSAR
ncbi:chymotrypsin-2-like [Cydia strobilella]|uniref:chymotrypsin-2-like n=1 Tax=Cydia strobilella TaxID=1100964 RepID=UPI003006B19F